MTGTEVTMTRHRARAHRLHLRLCRWDDRADGRSMCS